MSLLHVFLCFSPSGMPFELNDFITPALWLFIYSVNKTIKQAHTLGEVGTLPVVLLRVWDNPSNFY